MNALASLGFGAVTKAGWIAVAVVLAAMLTAVATLWYLNGSLRDDLAAAGERIGTLQTANVAAAGTIKAQQDSLVHLTDVINTQNAAFDKLLKDDEERRLRAAAALQQVAGEADRNKRDADALARALTRKGDLMRQGEPECVAAVRLIRESLK